MGKHHPLQTIPPRSTGFNIEGHPLSIIEMEDKVYFIAKEVGDLLGYANAGSSMIDLMTREWRSELQEGDDGHYLKLEGERLAIIKRMVPEVGAGGDIPCDTRDPLRFTSRLLLLTERGLWRVLILTGKPAGARLRDKLDSEILPQIRKTGSYALPGSDALRKTILTEVRELRALAADLRKAGDAEGSYRVLSRAAELAGATKVEGWPDPSTRGYGPVQPEDEALAQRAIRAVWAWINWFSARFVGAEKEDPTPANCYGRWDRRSNQRWASVAILPQHLDKLLLKRGFQPAQVISAWRDLGWLVHGEGHHVRRQVRMGGKPQRCVVICRGAFLSPGAQIEVGEA